MTTDADLSLNPQTDLQFTRSLPIPPETVWACWTTPEHLKRFFVPRPNAVTACDIDLRVGGRFNTTFDVGGTEMVNHGVFLEIVPNRRLVFTDAYEEGWKPVPEPFMTAIIEMEPEGEGGTRYTATARHRNVETATQHKQMGFFDGWGTVVDQLVEYGRTL